MRLAWFVVILGTALSLSAAEPSFDVQLREPAVGTDVAAGSTAFIAWEASAAPANVDEWEAFISVDGGRTYPLRVTPHLDPTIHRFRWTVPNVPGAEITVLLRFGDERDERRFVFPSRMRISGVAPQPSLWTAVAQIETGERGQAFDVDQEGATAWVEGSRDGSSLRHLVLAGTSMLSGRAEFDIPRADDSASALTLGAGRDDSIGRAVGEGYVAPDRTFLPRTRVCLRRFVTDILLISRRRNI